jgi:phospholipid-binding lipoprotein MlaA
VRDSIGLVGDAYMNPLYYRYFNLNEDYRLNWWQRTVVLGLNQINSFSMEPDTYEAILKESLDPYVTIRNAYHQNREGKIRD